MKFILSENILPTLSEHIYNVNQREKSTYYFNEKECIFFEELLNSHHELSFLYVGFIISNSVRDDVYEEELIIGYFRRYLKLNIYKIWDELLLLCSMSPKFLQFVLDSWAFDFEEGKYDYLKQAFNFDT